jgi:transposase
LEVASNAKARTQQTNNDAVDVESLVGRLSELKSALMVLEATGGYEFEVAWRSRPLA